ncbi:helix-turn-helix domain-containing protein [Embleya sp. AB8]|uniref:helix-turn-helix domain-containing protein n=1 Tax=Embleya sp. AB8 TaxID=3156304 RepID=UPI003C76039D
MALAQVAGKGAGRGPDPDPAADLVEVHRLVGSGRAGTAQVLGLLEERTGRRVLLFDRTGRVLRAAGGGPVPAAPASEVFAAGRSGVCAVGSASWLLVPLARDDLVLAAVGRAPLPDHLARFLADVAWLVAISYGREEHDAARVRLVESAFGLREGVVTLVLSGQIAAAQRVADRLGEQLPEPARVFVVDVDPAERDRIAVAGADVHDEPLWVARCTESARHVLVVAPTGCAETLSATLAALDPRCVVGASSPLPLRHIAFGYERVLAAALPMARQSAYRWAVSAPDAGLARTVGAAGRPWAREFLRPLTAHRPARAQDPSGDDLVVTLRVWLAYDRESPQRLYLHRNTLTARLRLIAELLDVDLSTIGGQAVASLALGFDALEPYGGPPPRGRSADSCAPTPPDTHTPEGFGPAARAAAGAPADADLDCLYASAAAGAWAAETLHGVLDPPGTTEATTLRAWLAHDTRTGPTADALGISVPALRKRLARLSTRLGIDVLGGRQPRRDLWLALRITEGRAVSPAGPTPRQLRSAQ